MVAIHLIDSRLDDRADSGWAATLGVRVAAEVDVWIVAAEPFAAEVVAGANLTVSSARL